MVFTSIAIASSLAMAQASFPRKPIRLIVAFPPGGSTTVVARLVGQKLAERLGQSVVVDNRPGANGVIASEELIRSAPDGHTLLMVVITHAINPSVMPSMPYDTVKDFAPVSTLYRYELALVTHPSFPVSNVAELIAFAKTKPGQINLAAGDNGGQTHLANEMFNVTAGVKVLTVPYKGSGPALTDTIAGHVQGYFSSVTGVIPYVKTGKLKAIAVTGKSRNSALPDVPTFAESGLPAMEAGGWAGILAPAATPKDVINKLSSEFAAIMAMPDVRESLAAQGLDASTTTPEQFGSIIRTDIGKFGHVIKTANIKFDK